MATIIDALIVTFGLDPRAFKKGIKEVDDALDKIGKKSAKPAKAIEDVGKKGAEAMGKLRNELLRTAAAFIGLSAVKSFVASVTQSDAAMGRMARNVGISTETLTAWEGVADRAGGSAESMAGDMKGLAQQVQRFSLTGEGGEAFKYFRALGVAVTDSRGKMRSLSDIYLEVADKFSGMDPTKAQAMGAGMGMSEGTVNTILMGRKALEAMLAEQARVNVRTKEDAQNAIERQNAWKLLTGTFNRLATDILNVVSPALVGLMNFIRDHAPGAAFLLGSITVAMTAMSLIKFGSLLSGLAQVSSAFVGVAGSSSAMLAIVGRLGLLGAVGTGVYAITALLLKVSGITDKLGDLGAWEATNEDPSMAGGYVPGTVKGLGNKGGKAAPAGGGATGDTAGLFASLEKQYGLPAGLLDSVWAQESTRGKKMLSPKGAKGHFGFMPDTAKAYGLMDPNDLGQSAFAAAHMYSDLLKQYKGNLPMALAGYNEGSGNLAKNGMGNLPRETQGYIRDIMGRMSGGGGSSTVSTTSSRNEMHIGQVIVKTAATDAPGIARDLHSALSHHAFATQANQGLS